MNQGQFFSCPTGRMTRSRIYLVRALKASSSQAQAQTLKRSSLSLSAQDLPLSGDSKLGRLNGSVSWSQTGWYF